MVYPKTPRGRGSADNPTSRFFDVRRQTDEEAWVDPEEPSPSTSFLKNHARSAITYNDSPDVGPGATINPYRGCEHGCVYCYARPTHEYFGFSSGLEFESKILVKEDAPELLRKELSSKKWKPQVIGMSGVTDCYQPAERRYKLTRRCLEVLADFRNPVAVITKNFLVTRDIDVLKRLAEHQAVMVFLSITTLDGKLTRVMEPRASHPARRLEAIAMLTAAGIPAGVTVAPVIPGLTDHEMPSILAAARNAGAIGAGYVPLRLPYGVKHLFEGWLGRHFPDRKDKVLNRIRSMRDGKLNDPDFNTRMQGKGVFADQLGAMFEVSLRKTGFPEKRTPLSTAAFRRPRTGDLFPEI